MNNWTWNYRKQPAWFMAQFFMEMNFFWFRSKIEFGQSMKLALLNMYMYNISRVVFIVETTPTYTYMYMSQTRRSFVSFTCVSLIMGFNFDITFLITGLYNISGWCWAEAGPSVQDRAGLSPQVQTERPQVLLLVTGTQGGSGWWICEESEWENGGAMVKLIII